MTNGGGFYNIDSVPLRTNASAKPESFKTVHGMAFSNIFFHSFVIVLAEVDFLPVFQGLFFSILKS